MQPNRAVRWFPAFFLTTLVTALIVLAVSVWVQARMLAPPALPAAQVIAKDAAMEAVSPPNVSRGREDAPIRVDVVATRSRGSLHASLRDCAPTQVC